MTYPRFLVSPDTLAERRVSLTGTELHHLRVRRLHVGSQVILSDGQGAQRLGTVIALDRRRAVIDLEENPEPHCESPLRLVLAQAALKADKMDLVIEKATELGVSEVQMFTSERSLAQPSAERYARWQRIARSAAKQCQRSTVPLLTAVVPFETVLSRTESLRILFWERRGRQAGPRPGPPQSSRDILVVIGPEGGFTEAEAKRAAAHGLQLWSLGPRVLRAETAALAAVALCQFLWGDLR